MDNDGYGHVNNVQYYSYFDTAVNTHLIERGGLDISEAEVIGVVVETSCRFAKELKFPEVVEAGIRVTRVGTSSVVYEIALFKKEDEEPAATGRFVHVYINRRSRDPVAVPDAIREALKELC